MSNINPIENTNCINGCCADGWRFDFSSLPRWDVRDRIPFVYDKFYPVLQKDMLFCIYSIAEVSMMWYVGFLAVLKNKQHPKLVLNITEKINFCDNFSTSKNGDIVFLQACVYNKATSKVNCPILIIDIARRKFSYYKTENYNPCYKVVELSDCVFGIEADELQRNTDARLNTLANQIIDLRCLEWYDLNKINTLTERL